MRYLPHCAVASVRRLKDIPADMACWSWIRAQEDLIVDEFRRAPPLYVFFPFWRTKVPAEITSEFECVCFHMTDVPYGRGGSPLQNLIVRGHSETVISALRMTDELDAGPVYMKRPLSLKGNAEEIYSRAFDIIIGMMREITAKRPAPAPQQGIAVSFKRRTPPQSQIPFGLSGENLYDFIRMLDADGYPRAFIRIGDMRVEFRNAEYRNGKVYADAEICW
jgi:methionyl-tRNA formyltransferase